MADLFDLVLHHIEGNETTIENWETKDGRVSYAITSYGPDRWIERAALGRLMAIDLLALILFSIRDEFNLEKERRIVEGWAVELRKAASVGEIQARDPITLLALETLPDGWEWLLSEVDADKFISARGMGWTPSERVDYLLEQCRQIGKIYDDPKTGQTVKREWLAGYEQKQPAPAQNTATPAPVESASDGPATAAPNWKMRVQTEATELFIRLLASGANPTPHSLLGPLAQWCRDNDVKTDGGINPSEGYLRTHVLGGGHWTPPLMSREQAKKHVAQVAQEKVAQTAQQHT